MTFCWVVASPKTVTCNPWLFFWPERVTCNPAPGKKPNNSYFKNFIHPRNYLFGVHISDHCRKSVGSLRGKQQQKKTWRTWFDSALNHRFFPAKHEQMQNTECRWKFSVENNGDFCAMILLVVRSEVPRPTNLDGAKTLWILGSTTNLNWFFSPYFWLPSTVLPAQINSWKSWRLWKKLGLPFLKTHDWLENRHF